MLTNKFMKNRIWVIVFGMILLFTMMPQRVMAADPSLIIEYEYDGKMIEGAQFDIYHVADLQLVKTEEFAEFAGTLDEKDSAKELADYVKANGNILPAASMMVNEEISLPAGIYLAIGQPLESAGVVYKCAPFLVSLTTGQKVAYPKAVTPEEFIDITVMKIWNDNNDAADKRTEEVRIELLLDGEVFETVVLNEENDWMYTFTKVPGASDWDAREIDVPEGYEVSVESEMAAEGKLLEFEIINTYKVVTERPSRLPQTGMLNWPVPVLAGAGLVCFMIGWGKRQKDEM